MAIVLEKMSNYTYENPDHGSQIISCPRYMKDVYTLGIDLQYYIGDMYLHLAELNQGEEKAKYQKMAVSELEIKQRMQEINEAHLNEMLSYFYNSGGQIVEASLGSEQAKEIQPFFNRIMATFIKRLERATLLVVADGITPEQLNNMIDDDITEMCGNMCKLFKVDEIVRGFEVLTEIRENFRK